MSYQEKCFIYLNLFDIYMKPTLRATSVLYSCHFPSNQLCIYVSKKSYFSKFFKHVWHAPKMAPVFLLPFPPSLSPSPCSRTNKASDSNWNLLSGLTPDEANIFRPPPPSVTHTHTHTYMWKEWDRAILPTEPTVKSYHPDFSLICEARVNGKPCLACLIWEVTESEAVSVSCVCTQHWLVSTAV